MGIGLVLPTPQDLKVLLKHLKVVQTAQTCNLEDPEWGVSSTPPKNLMVFLEVLLS